MPFERACGPVLLVLCAVFLTACGDGGVAASTVTFTNNVADRQVFRTYEGVASTAVRLTDTLGQTHTRNYAISVAVEVSPPLRAAVSGQVELNPFHFRVDPAFPGATAEEGLYTIVSAAVIFQGSESLLQLWRFAERGTSFSGELVQPPSPLSQVGNQINLPSDQGSAFPVPVSFPLARGTRVTGTMTSDNLHFRLDGNTTDGRHPFVSEVTATRIR